ncbi:PadR family transcriptional regulator [Sphingomonas carotinifaciens]|uniref:PadR family transcriptional regulator n=1 Tax=Sphingomonas carotinifaciens TaxID=1166323 RepID=A0A1G7NHB6_9SPHN|nr:PadR family transcriptional regulator [Sphingomonas carotinifaciens]MBB4087082.1 DNA-binding PadR family transcriptional regulator [Sphingomonas carotinifaciens]MWC43231.1 PadR family transcriptional regulator [Sphingomonas carotinifaciens]SDF73311.1 Transcriptional regulator PadR-like family protein [Sphingomonas carotinifaciens]
MPRSRALSPHARTVLSVLLDAGGQWSHGYELVRLAGVKSGTLYPLLIRLEAQGYLEAEWQQPTEGGRPPRHAYRLTASGVQLARANPPEPSVAPASHGGRATI